MTAMMNSEASQTSTNPNSTSSSSLSNKQQQPPSSTFYSSSQTLLSQHQDFVHDIAFDHYGRRVATCSGDRTVRVWDLDDAGNWILSSTASEWQAHRGSVTKLSWAHPEFGQLLATCGSDHAATIWEERTGGGFATESSPQQWQSSQQQQPPPGRHQGGGNVNNVRWANKANLTDARKAVSCVEFAPRHLGLKIATGSADGLVRIYEAIDVMNLNQWPMNGSIEVETNNSNRSMNPPRSSNNDDSSDLGVTSLSWCHGRFCAPTIVVGGSSGVVSVYRYSDASRVWQNIVKLPGHTRGVLDVAWGPNVGRSYHLIASAGKDRALRLHRLKRCLDGERKKDASSLELESSQVLDTGVAEVWRCAWNVTGTVLASSGDAGIVQLFKSDFRNQWKCVSEVHGDVEDHQQ